MEKDYVTHDQLSQLFGRNFAIRKVTETDVTKGYYYPDKKQRKVMSSAGFEPKLESDEYLIEFKQLLGDQVYISSYYKTIRKGSGRKPETRIGRGLTNYYSKGDELAICSDGKTLFVGIVSNKIKSLKERFLKNSLEDIDIHHLRKLAIQNGKISPIKSTVQNNYLRSGAVNNYIFKRANGRCEYPECDSVGFLKDDGSNYFEVHHIQPLSEGGGDTIYNAVLLCANCHRKAHFWDNRNQMNLSLQNHVNNRENNQTI